MIAETPAKPKKPRIWDRLKLSGRLLAVMLAVAFAAVLICALSFGITYYRMLNISQDHARNLSDNVHGMVEMAFYQQETYIRQVYALSQANLLDRRLSELSAQGRSPVVLNVTMPEGATSLTTTLSQSSLDSLVSTGAASLELNGGHVSLALDQAALQAIQAQSAGQVTLNFTPVENLFAQARAFIGDRPVYDITITYEQDGQTRVVTDLNLGQATILIPYPPASGEDTARLCAVYIDDSGSAYIIREGAYNEARGGILFTTGHLSLYAIGSANPAPQKARLFGQDRYRTAVEIALSEFAGGADTVILARGDIPTDALPAVPLAVRAKAPLRLTPPDRLPGDVLPAIQKIGAKKVIITGGPGAVNETVADTLKASGLEVERIYGQTRYDTAYEIARRLDPDGTAVLVNGDRLETTFADAVSVSSWAGYHGVPILLVNGASAELPAAVAQALKEFNMTRTVIIGGTGVVPAHLERRVPNPERYGGQNLYATNAVVLKNLQPAPASFYTATAANLADALAGAAAAARTNSWILLTGAPATAAGLAAEQEALLEAVKHSITSWGIFGGSAAVPEKTEGRIKALISR